MASARLKLAAELSLSIDGERMAGSRHLALLAQIAHTGSITHAAKAVGLSYKGAWDAVEHMSNLAGEALVARTAGGKGGGSTQLTARGDQLAKNFALIEVEHRRFVARLNSKAKGLKKDYAMLEAIAIRTSARNQFAGTVSAIRDGAVNDEIEISVIGDQRIVAIITSDSRRELKLAVGTAAFALIKASSIILMTGGADARLSARNQLAGTVTRMTPGAVNSEVTLQMAGGGTITAIVTEQSSKNLRLEVGAQACAIFKASSVIVGVSA